MIEAAELEDWRSKMYEKNMSYLHEFALSLALERPTWLENVTTKQQAASRYQQVGYDLRQLEESNYPNYNTEMSVGVIDAAVEWSETRGRFLLKSNVNVEKMRED